MASKIIGLCPKYKRRMPENAPALHCGLFFIKSNQIKLAEVSPCFLLALATQKNEIDSANRSSISGLVVIISTAIAVTTTTVTNSYVVLA